jgi:Erv1 / Alr family
MQFVNNTGPFIQPAKQIVFSMPKMSATSIHNTQNSFVGRVPQAIMSIPVPNNFPGQAFPPSYQNAGMSNRKALQQAIAPPPAPAPKGPPTGKMRWGPPIWTLFHTLAEKVKPEYFPALKMSLLNTIYSICVNLPCPDCANHATQYMNSLNFNAIQTKDDLKEVLFRFHNSVNLRKNSPAFDFAELTAKYSAANTSVVIQEFMEVFTKKNYSVRMIANDFHKNRSVTQIKQWLANSLQYFDP